MEKHDDDLLGESPAAMARKIEGVRARLYGAQVLVEGADPTHHWSAIHVLLQGSIEEVNWAIDTLTAVKERMAKMLC